MTRAGAYRDLPVTVPCGQCIGCRLERSRQWAVRCVHEASLHDRNTFLTLTYEDRHLPPHGTLDVTHWQKFAKRLRQKYGPFRFFHCGEYGDQNGRPHYHAAIFGLDFYEGRKLYKNSKTGDPLYTNPKLDEVWGKGLAVFGELSFASAAYVARYIMKKVTGPLAESHYQELDPITGELHQLKPEYITMSRNPGIGKKWIEKYLDEVYPDDFIVMNGKTSRPPKYYDQVLETLKPEIFHALKTERRHQASLHEADQTPDRIETSEICQLARMREIQRDL